MNEYVVGNIEEHFLSEYKKVDEASCTEDIERILNKLASIRVYSVESKLTKLAVEKINSVLETDASLMDISIIWCRFRIVALLVSSCLDLNEDEETYKLSYSFMQLLSKLTIFYDIIICSPVKKQMKSIKCKKILEKMIRRNINRSEIILNCILNSEFYDCKDHRAFLIIGPCMVENLPRFSEQLTNFTLEQFENFNFNFIKYFEQMSEFFKYISIQIYKRYWDSSCSIKLDGIAILNEITKHVSFEFDELSVDICKSLCMHFSRESERLQTIAQSLLQTVIIKTKKIATFFIITQTLINEAKNTKYPDFFYKVLSMIPSTPEISAIIISSMLESLQKNMSLFFLQCYYNHFKTIMKDSVIPEEIINSCFDIQNFKSCPSVDNLLKIYFQQLVDTNAEFRLFDRISVILSSSNETIRKIIITQTLPFLAKTYQNIFDSFIKHYFSKREWNIYNLKTVLQIIESAKLNNSKNLN